MEDSTIVVHLLLDIDVLKVEEGLMIVDHRHLEVGMMIGEEGGQEGGKETAVMTIGREGGAVVLIVVIEEEVDIKKITVMGSNERNNMCFSLTS